jgi:hypothetical protein
MPELIAVLVQVEDVQLLVEEVTRFEIKVFLK